MFQNSFKLDFDWFFMKQYLFMFPLEPYFENEVENPLLLKTDFEMEGLDRLITERYKKKDFEVNWVLLCQEKNKDVVDTSNLTPYLSIQKQDRKINSGVSYRDFFEKDIIFDPEYILNQVPQTEKLVVGGFHAPICVESVAMAAHTKGINVVVDEQTTEHFFALTRYTGKMPVAQTNFKLQDLIFIPWILKEEIKQREEKPWLSV